MALPTPAPVRRKSSKRVLVLGVVFIILLGATIFIVQRQGGLVAPAPQATPQQQGGGDQVANVGALLGNEAFKRLRPLDEVPVLEGVPGRENPFANYQAVQAPAQKKP